MKIGAISGALAMFIYSAVASKMFVTYLHFINNILDYIVTILDSLINIQTYSFTSIRCRFGNLKHILSLGENNDTVTTK